MPLLQWLESAELGAPVTLTPPIRRDGERPRAFGLTPLHIEASRVGNWVGARAAGASVNCDDVRLSTHGSGTHTECVGHVSDLPHTIADVAPKTLLRALVITVAPLRAPDGDHQIHAHQLEQALAPWRDLRLDAIVIRTLQNDESPNKDWSGTNPPYFHRDAIVTLVRRGILHLVTDLPSIDREDDGGLLAAHRAFFGLWPKSDPARPAQATVTELAYIPTSLPDGPGILRLDTLDWPSDAAPSRPIFYPLSRR